VAAVARRRATGGQTSGSKRAARLQAAEKKEVDHVKDNLVRIKALATQVPNRAALRAMLNADESMTLEMREAAYTLIEQFIPKEVLIFTGPIK
jgi:hypothetical protein